MIDVVKLAQEAKEASRVLAKTPTAKKDLALRAMAQAIRKAKPQILHANLLESAAAAKAGENRAFVDRLKLDDKRIEAIAAALEQVARLPDPVGKLTEFALRPNGLRIRKMRVPLGVICIVYESRPGVTADAAGLCVKSGNACILRGGREAIKTNALIVQALRAGLKEVGLPESCVGFIDDPDRGAVARLLEQDAYIDLVIPRGGPELTRSVRKQSAIPVLAHDKGLCHTYVDKDANIPLAIEVCLNAKAERPGVCNAMETLLVHESVAADFLPKMWERYLPAGVKLRGCEKTLAILPTARPATAEDWDTEYLDLILSIKVVASLDEAIAHIARHGSGLAEAIITKDNASAQRFQKEVDAGAVYWNTSTRFTDGGEFGLGAEMGISTQKIHARGPVGLEGLTCEKFVVDGAGQVRRS